MVNKQNRYHQLQIGITLFIILITIISSIFGPTYLSSFFEGEDKTLWLRPFLIWMGFLFMLYTLLPFFIKEINLTSESYLAGVCLLFFAGLMTFVSIQRFTSGCRLIETYNEIISIRFSQGGNIYHDPESGAMGTIYTPFFIILNGLLHRVLPDGFAYGRLISLFSSIGTSYIVYKIIRQRKGEKEVGIWASALFFVTYSIMMEMYDHCFADSLLMLCLCITLYFFLLNTPSGDRYSLFFGGLACFTKQTAIYPFLFILIFIIFSRRKIMVYYPLIFWGIIATVLITVTKGWAITYLITYPMGHGYRMFPPPEILRNFFLFQTPLWIGAFYGIFHKKQNRFLFFFLAVLVASLFGVFKIGGWFNALFPIEPLLCIAGADLLKNKKLLLICQLILGLYNPFNTLYPWASIRDIDQKIITLASNAKGEIWIPMDSYLYESVDKKEWDNICALFGPSWSGYDPPQRLIQALQQKTFELILIRKNSMMLFKLFDPQIKDLIKENYQKEETGKLVVYRRK